MVIVDVGESPIERPKKTARLRAASQQSLRSNPERIRVRVGKRKGTL